MATFIVKSIKFGATILFEGNALLQQVSVLFFGRKDRFYMEEEIRVEAIPPRLIFANFLREQMKDLGLMSQAKFAGRLRLGLTKVNGWMRGRGPLPKASDWKQLETVFGNSDVLASIRELLTPKPRPRFRFKGFMDGDGI
jgi:hypothetical protein